MTETGPYLTRQRQLERLRALIENEAGAPKHQAVSNALLKALSDGIWEAGEKLPTEIELAHTLALSHGTVQKAYQRLVSDGLVVRRRGSGSYVTNALRQMAEPWHCRFLDDDGSCLPVFPQVIGNRKRVRAPQAARVLGAAEIGRIDRKILIGTEFVVLSRFYASSDVIRSLLGLAPGVLDGANFKAVLLRDLQRPIVSIAQTVVLSCLDREVAALVGCRPRSSGLRIEAVAHSGNSTPIYYQELHVPPTERRLLFESVYRPYAADSWATRREKRTGDAVGTLYTVTSTG